MCLSSFGSVPGVNVGDGDGRGVDALGGLAQL